MTRNKKESILAFKELEIELRKSPLLLINTKSDKTDFKEFILDFINNLNIGNFAIITNNLEGTEPLYKDKRRSLEDLYRLIISYFPETTLIDLAKFLTEQCENSNLSGHVCPDINKIVFTNSTLFKYKLSDKHGYGFNFGMDEGQRRTVNNIYYDDFLNLLD